jgi:hypothetical protein
MFRSVLSAILLGLAVLGVGTIGSGGPPAYAQGCVSAGEARSYVQSGDVVPLSQVLSAIRSAAGGEILPPPRLCNVGGRLVYLVNVLSRGGEVRRLTVDARSGNIVGGY